MGNCSGGQDSSNLDDCGCGQRRRLHDDDGLVRKRLTNTLKDAMSGVTQFGFVPGRGTEEAICKALTHIDEARARSN